MDRLLVAMANAERRLIVEFLLESEIALTPSEIRSGMDIPSERRGQIGRQISKLYDVGILERTPTEEYSVADPEVVGRFLLAADQAEAALDGRRAKRSAAATRDRHGRDTRRRTDRAAHEGHPEQGA